MECKVKNEYGTVYIAEDVMMKVVGYAALECYGIVAMSGKRAPPRSHGPSVSLGAQPSSTTI